MSAILGVVFAFAAMLCWGFGDFLIQKSTRKFGDWETMFIITLLSTIVLTPFLLKKAIILFRTEINSLLILAAASIILLIAGLLDFEALKQGKLSVVEPLWSLEIIVSAIIAFFVAGEIISNMQILTIITLIVGLCMVSLRSYHLSKKVWFEKGTLVAILAAITMGIANYFTGIGSRSTNALLAIWFMHGALMIFSLIYLASKKDTKKLFKHIKKNKSFLLCMSTLDTLAWIAFAAAMIYSPIAIAVALSESYIVITVLLGMYINKEYLRKHQKIGLVLAIASAIILAAITI